MIDPMVIGFSQFSQHIDIHEAFPTEVSGYAADIGASDGLTRNNTYQLEMRGWDVLCVEASPVFQKDLKARRKRVVECACGKEDLEAQKFYVYEVVPGNFEAISSLKPEKDRPVHQNSKPKYIAEVPVRKLDTLLDEAGFPRLDVLSIDVEGGESDVLDGFTFSRWKPKIVILESWKPGAFNKRMGEAGYGFKTRRGVDDVYLRIG